MSPRGKTTVRIENKAFSCEYDERRSGNYVRIVEKHGRRHFEITVEAVAAVWIADNIDDLLLAPPTQKFFRKTNCNGGFLWIQKTTNKRGSFLEVTKVQSSGGKRNLVIPSDDDCKGWRNFRMLILDFLNGKNKMPSSSNSKVSSMPPPSSSVVCFARENCSFADIVKANAKQQEDTPLELEKEVRKGFIQRKGAGGLDVMPLNWDDTIVITRRDFHDDWNRILSVVKEQTESSFIINPFQADKALLKCPSREMTHLLLSNRGWVTFGPLTVKVEAWNPVRHGRVFMIPSYGNWVKVRNIPLHL